MKEIRFPYHSLSDYLVSHPHTVDARLDDGWGAKFSLKGREIDAVILFADIAGFSLRTKDLSPIEILIFVNNFIAWITAEAVQRKPCLVDKYIGDEIMLIFSKEFGSDDPFLDALITARWMSERDALSFCPHMGIAAGKVIVGYVGTPIQYNCSVFGKPVTLASRCAGVKPQGMYSSSIVLPSELWGSRRIEEVFEPVKYSDETGKTVEKDLLWRVLNPRKENLRGIGEIEIVEIINPAMYMPSQSAEDRARVYLALLIKTGQYRPV